MKRITAEPVPRSLSNFGAQKRVSAELDDLEDASYAAALSFSRVDMELLKREPKLPFRTSQFLFIKQQKHR